MAATTHWWREQDRLVRALVLSVLVHLLLYGTWSFGNQHHLWDKRFLPAWLLPVRQKAMTDSFRRAEAEKNRMPELRFVEVSPRQAIPEAPDDAKFYSSLNSKAANPKRDTETDTPKIDGEQVKVFKTEDIPQVQPKPSVASTSSPLQPTLPPPKPAEPLEPLPEDQHSEQPKAEPKPTQLPGDLALSRPSDTIRDTHGQDEEERPQRPSPRERPRTLAEARARQGIQGQKVKQEGGVLRMEDLSSVDAKATPFGAYDAALIAAVQSHWYSLIDRTRSYNARSGRVVVEFRLLPDGRVINVKISEESVGELLSMYCQLAISGAAPFGPWPSDMRRMAGNHRDVRFTFYYN